MDDPKPEMIEQDMAATRSSLFDKIAALEQQVVATVQSATTAVQDTVQSVTSAVHDTTSSVREGLIGVGDDAKQAVHGLTDSVKGAFDMTTHVRENPAVMVGGAAVVGFLTGLLVFGKATPAQPAQMGKGSEPAPVPPYRPSYAAGYATSEPAPQSAPQATPRQPTWLDELMSRAGHEVVKLGEQAISKAVAQVRTAIDEQVPRLVDTLVANGAERVGMVGQHRHG